MRDFRAVLTTFFMGLWGFMIFQNPHEPLIVGAMIANVAAIAGYYYGYSQASAKRQSGLQNVVVTNDPTNPVPVEQPKETL